MIGVDMARARKNLPKKSLPNPTEHSPSPRLVRWSSLLKIASLCFIASTVVGYTLGKALSPKYDDSSTTAAYVLGHLEEASGARSWSFEYLPVTDLVTSMRPVSGILEFSCHCKIFFYDMGARKTVGPMANPSSDCLGGVQRRGLEFKDTLSVLIGSLEGYSVKMAITESRTYWVEAAERSIWRRVRMLLTSSVAVVSGVALGFYWGYEEKPNCEEAAFAREISSSSFWEIVGAQWISQHSWRFKYDRPTYSTSDLDKSLGFGHIDRDHPLSGDLDGPEERARLKHNTPSITLIEVINGRRFFVFDDFWKDVQGSRESRANRYAPFMLNLFSSRVDGQFRRNKSIRSPSFLWWLGF